MATEALKLFGSLLATDRDDQANREVASILEELPDDHLARRAFARGRRTADITTHLGERRDLTCKVLNASWDCYRRAKRRHGKGFPPCV